MGFAISDNVQTLIPYLGIDVKTKKDVAKRVTAILKAAGIDVVDGLDPDEAVGRLPLSYFLLEFSTRPIFVGSYADGAIDYLTQANKYRYPGKYFLCHDEGSWVSGSNLESKVVGIVAKPVPSNDVNGHLKLYYQEPKKYGMLFPLGQLVYDPIEGTINFSGAPGARAELYPFRQTHDSYGPGVAFQLNGEGATRYNVTSDTYVLSTDENEDVNDILRKTISWPVPTTGAGIKFSYNSFEVTTPRLPGPTYLKGFVDRMTFDVDAHERERYYRHATIGDVFEVNPLTPEELEEAKVVLRAELDKKIAEENAKKRNAYRCHGYVHTAYAMALTQPPKGERRPIGHIIIGASDGAHYEYCEFAVARTSTDFGINDIYLRTKKSGVVAFRRCGDRTMTALKELIGDPQVVKSTLNIARNLNNRYAASAAIGSTEENAGTACVPASILRTIASLSFGVDFIEWSYRMGFVTMANELCERINSRKMWDAVASMQDLIPGFVDGSKSLYTCLGMPKAWGKETFDLCQAKSGKDFSKGDLHDAVISMQIAWELEAALTNGKPSEASVPARAFDYAALWREHLEDFDLSSGRRTVARQDHWLFSAYGNDPIGMADAVRACHRMLKKAAKQGAYDRGSKVYLIETFQAYCQIKSIGENPEAHGVLFEYGLPENDPVAARDMIKRRCEAAQEVVKGYQAILAAKEHASQDAKYAEHKKALWWLECSDPKVCENYVFKLPTKLYGDDDPLSVQSEGVMQSNCLFGSYLNKLMNGEYIVVFMRERSKPDSSAVTIGITKSLTIDQTFGYRNSCITASQAQAIRQWIDKVNSRGNGVLKLRQGGPGGWHE